MAKLILSSDGFKCINKKFGVDQDSLAHLAVKSGSRELVSYLRYSGSIDLSILNKRGKKFYEVMTVSDPDWERELRSFYDGYKNSVIQANNHKPRHQELADMNEAKIQSLLNGLEKQKKAGVDSTRSARNAINPPPSSSAYAVEAAAKAEAELLAMLDAETSATVKSKSNSGKGGGNKGKKK